MKKLFTVCLFAMLVFSTRCIVAQTAMTPLQFNDQLTSITDSLFVRGQQWGTKFTEAIKSKDFSSLKVPRESIERFVTSNIARVKAMKDVKNSYDLRMAMISFLEFEKGMITKAFKPIESLSPSATQEEVSAAYEALRKHSATENVELAKVNLAQEEYAKSNGFRIETAEEAAKSKP